MVVRTYVSTCRQAGRQGRTKGPCRHGLHRTDYSPCGGCGLQPANGRPEQRVDVAYSQPMGGGAEGGCGLQPANGLPEQRVDVAYSQPMGGGAEGGCGLQPANGRPEQRVDVAYSQPMGGGAEGGCGLQPANGLPEQRVDVAYSQPANEWPEQRVVVTCVSGMRWSFASQSVLSPPLQLLL